MKRFDILCTATLEEDPNVIVDTVYEATIEISEDGDIKENIKAALISIGLIEENDNVIIEEGQYKDDFWAYDDQGIFAVIDPIIE